MGNILYNISQVLGITIIHSLWQGMLIYFALRMVLMFAEQLSASKKYVLASASLLAITAWFMYTLVNEIGIYNWLAVAPEKLSALPLMLDLPRGIHQFNDQTIRYYYSVEEYLPYISLLYIAGLVLNTVRLILSRKKINTIRQTMSIDVDLQYKVTNFAGMLNIAAKVKIGITNLVDVPCMIGYFKPVILLPFTLSTYLSADEIEAILLHELTHIKRNDYLVNLIQQVISILLFFNPCALIINKIINEERENCCDDLVVKATANPMIYAKALLKLEQNRQNDWKLALAATGKKYHLLNRIERIMKTQKQTQSLRPALLATLILTIGMGCIALLNPEIAQGKVSVKAIKPVIARLLDDTVKKKAVITNKTAVRKKAYKAKVAEKENADDNTSFAYSYNFHYNNGWNFHDPELDRLSKEVEKHGNAIDKYYNSGDFKTTQEELEQKGKVIDDFYNKPELKDLEERQQKLSEDFEKNWAETDETRQTSEQMEKLGKDIETYYNSAEFKTMNEALEKKYNIPHEHYYNDSDDNENYRNYRAELRKNTSADVLQKTVELKQLGQKIRERYRSPEFEKQKAAVKAVGDSMKIAFHNPQIKEQQEEMRKLGAKMREFGHSPEITREKELLKEASAKMHAYMRTPDFRKRLEAYKKAHPQFSWSDDEDRPEQPEKPEAPEAPEKPENNN